MTESGVIAKTALVFGQMNEPPGARLRVGLSRAHGWPSTSATQGKDVLLFIDNIFRFVQAGSEVSALLGRMPSAWAISRRSARRWANCRSASPRPNGLDHVRAGRLRAGRRHHRPGARRRRSLTSTATIVLSRRSPNWASIPRSTAGLPPRASSTRESSVDEHYRRRPRYSRYCSATRTCRTSSRSSGWTSCLTRTSCRRSRAQGRAVSLAADLRGRAVHGTPGKYVRSPTPCAPSQRSSRVSTTISRAGFLHGRHH